MRHLVFRASLAFVAVVCISLTSCSRVFWVQPSGSINSGVHFEFYEDPDRSTEATLRVTEVSVVKLDQDGNEAAQWSLTGRARVSSIDYGIVPKGLTEQIAAMPLEPDSVYEIRVHDDPVFPSPASGGALFRLNATGEVVICRTFPACWDD